MKKTIMLLLLSMLAGSVAAQESTLHIMGAGANAPVELRTMILEDEVILNAYKKVPGKYTLNLSFGATAGKYKILHGPVEEVLRSKYGLPNFEVAWIPGEVNGKIQEDFVYRLPFEEGMQNSVRIHKHTPKTEKSNRIPTERISYIFSVSEGDDVYAMRKGVVASIEDTEWYLEGFLNNQVLRKANKLIVVEHRDGTSASYVGILDGTVEVKAGETVYPDTILGKAGTLNDEEYEIIVRINYLKAPIIRDMLDIKNVKLHNLDPCFLTGEGIVRIANGMEFECVVTDELVEEEMTRREQRKRNKK